ncbi:T9SS type A sorting domain-containing protein [Flavobacterium sp.]|uniref:T9SS type A sorting domain-containing protein n=1 Tax=Flavobacterium sp. TaxID=239 RepID=UPI0008BC76B1|nr:T9SS type A sorting domain-containing protein [Flavobacterium sp.]OGS60820.1 MAG: glycosyl hydrolase [Flavobacteria bacterium GWF1_32_7]HBD26351.1 glycosyl hydrolase [Flavobacterium sp.]
MIKNYLIVSLLCSFLGFSQFNSSAPWMTNINTAKNGEATINEMVNAFNSYWSTRDKNARGSGYKPFMRWEYHWRNYTNEQGYVMPAEHLWEAWRQKKQAIANRSTASRALPPSNWQPVGPFTHTNTGSWSSGQGRVNIVHVDPNNASTIYLGAPAGGIWKSINNGSTWAPLTDELPQIGVSGIAVDYSNSNTIYIATGDKDAGDSYSVGVYKSIDGGLTWNPTGTMGASNPTSAGDLLIHPTNNQILWCATNNGIFRTINGGTSWSRVRLGNFSQGSIRLKPGDPSVVYAVSNNGFFRSTNSGSSFTQVSTGLPASSTRLLLDVTPANANYIYILSATTGSAFQGIYRSTDGGTTFTARNTTTNVLESTQAWFDLALAVSSTNAEEIYTGCLNVWKSTNGGTSATKINNWSNPTGPSYTHADIHYLGFHGTKLFCGSDGGIYVSENNGSNFTDLTAGAQISQFYKIAVSKQSSANMVGGLQDNGGHAYSGGQWKNYYGADGMDTAIDPTNPNLYYGFIQSGGSLYISNSAGNGITGSVSSPGVDGNWVTPLTANNTGELFSGFDGLYKLVGSNWVLQNVDALGSGNLDEIAVDPSNDNIMYVANGTGLYKSTNRGVNFTNVYNSSDGSITFIEVHSTDSNIIYLVTDGASGKVLKSTDGGINFVDFSTGLPSIGKECIVHQGRHTDNPLYLGTSLGVYYRDDSMTQWEPFDTNLPNVSVRDLEINIEDAKLIAATYGRGIWQTAIPVQIPLVDLKFMSIQNPGININCGANVTPQIQVKNNGVNTISSVNVSYTIDAAPFNYTWNGTILSNETELIDLPIASLTRGMHTLSVNTTTSSDAYSDNNSGTTSFYTNDAGTVGVVNPFTNTTDALISYKEGASGVQWVRGTRAGGLTSSGNTVYTTNLTGNYPDNTKGYLVSQCYNLSNVINPQISFAMKYSLEPNWDVVYVEYSTNFGASWTVLGEMGPTWYNSDRTSATAGNDCYNCPGAQWTGANTTLTTYTYPLNALNSETNIIFRIVFHSDEAENDLGANIDDFLINGTLSGQSFELQNIVLYPNPSKGIFNLATGTNEISEIEVYDVTGKMVWSKKDFEVSNSEIQLNLSSVSQGIYFVKITADNQSTVKRIIKE